MNIRASGFTTRIDSAPKPGRFEVYKDRRGEWRWRLKAANNRIVAQGESHRSERDAWRAVDAVVRAAVSAQDDAR